MNKDLLVTLATHLQFRDRTIITELIKYAYGTVNFLRTKKFNKSGL